MRALFRNKFVIGSKRYRGFDYSSPGKYFVTICTNNKTPYFGNVENGEMILTEYGNIAMNLWFEIPDHCSNIVLDEFVVMPDHIHGIISIKTNSDEIGVETRHASFLQPINHNPDQLNTIDPKSIIHGKTRISPKSGSLGAIIGSYKSAVSKKIHQSDAGFKWQSRYYDRIIRTQSQLSRIRKYIRENPRKWSEKNIRVFTINVTDGLKGVNLVTGCREDCSLLS